MPLQEVVYPTCSEMESNGVEVAVVDGCVARLTFVQQTRVCMPTDLQYYLAGLAMRRSISNVFIV